MALVQAPPLSKGDDCSVVGESGLTIEAVNEQYALNAFDVKHEHQCSLTSNTTGTFPSQSTVMYQQSIDSTHRWRHDMILSDTTQQVRDQLVIVSKLRKQNNRYLTDVEKGWIDSIITSATTVIGKLDIPHNLATERDEPRRNRLKSPAFLQQTKSTIQASPIAAQNLTQLLVVAQTLNSAISLLSCCYERHKWATRQIKAIPLIEEDLNSDLALLLDRRRSRGQDRVSQLVRIASLCLKDTQASDDVSVTSDERYDTMRSPTESVVSGSSRDHSEPEGMLSLIIVESIDKWKRNAEMALEAATQQSTPSNMSEESLTQNTRSFGQQSRYDYIDDRFSGVRHSIREESKEETFGTTSEGIVTSSLPQERRSHSYDLRTGPETFSIRRKPPSRYLSDNYVPKTHQLNNILPQTSYDYHHPRPASQSSQRSQGPPTSSPPPPLPFISTTQQSHNSDNQSNPEIYSPPSSPIPTYASRILQSTPFTSGTARLVQLPKSSPNSNPSPSLNQNQHHTPQSSSTSSSSFYSSPFDPSTNPSGLNISHGRLPLSSSTRSDSSETIVCPSGSLGSRTSNLNMNVNIDVDLNRGPIPNLNSNMTGLKRISRGRAWLERQIEAH